jgi:hypothetical protein
MVLYQKHIFLFNDEFSQNFHIKILPLLQNPESLNKLFENESLILKKFIFEIERQITSEIELENMNSFYNKLRNGVLMFISKIIIENLNKEKITELYLNGTCIGKEGSQIVFLIIKLMKNLEYLDFSESILSDEDFSIILKAVESIDDYFTIDFEGSSMSLKTIKYITKIKADNYKLKIVTSNNITSNLSKMTGNIKRSKKWNQK